MNQYLWQTYIHRSQPQAGGRFKPLSIFTKEHDDVETNNGCYTERRNSDLIPLHQLTRKPSHKLYSS